MPDTLPAFPNIDGLDWSPPAQTDPVEMVRATRHLKIYADADNANYQDWVLDYESGGTPGLAHWWPGRAPQDREFVMRKYWKMVPGTFTHLYPGTQFRKSWAYAHGVSTTDSQSITATVGISGEGLSAGLSATFSHSVTINDQQSTTTEYSVSPPASGVRVWLLWDLTYEFIIAKPGTVEPIPAGEYRGDVDFTNDAHYSGAYMNYRWTHLTVSSGILCPQSRDFA